MSKVHNGSASILQGFPGIRIDMYNMVLSFDTDLSLKEFVLSLLLGHILLRLAECAYSYWRRKSAPKHPRLCVHDLHQGRELWSTMKVHVETNRRTLSSIRGTLPDYSGDTGLYIDTTLDAALREVLPCADGTAVRVLSETISVTGGREIELEFKVTGLPRAQSEKSSIDLSALPPV